MADSITQRRIANRARWKRWALPSAAAALAFALAALFGYHPVAALLNLFQNVLLAIVGSSDTSLMTGHPLLQRIVEWVAAPIVWFVLILGLVSLPPIARIINRLFPDPPPFVMSDLDARRRSDMILIEQETTPFVGRSSDLEMLAMMLDRTVKPDPFQWRVLLGPSGIGKTRLAIEWLAAAQAKGWDIGIVDPNDKGKLAGWRPRRPTALVIDEARLGWDEKLANAMLRLGEGATARKPVRLLLIDQIEPYVKHEDAGEQHKLDVTQITPTVSLDEMTPDDIRAILCNRWPSADVVETDHMVALSAGRPRAAIILVRFPDAKNYAEALHRWAVMLVRELKYENDTPPTGTSVALIFAALVGPVSVDHVRRHAADYEPGALIRFFQGARREDLEGEIPRLVPDDLAHELALCLLPKLDRPRREAVIAEMMAASAARMEASLGNIWRDRPELDRASEADPQATVLRMLQKNFDEAFPDRIETVREQAESIVYALKNGSSADSERTLERLSGIVAMRPFDPAIRLEEANGAVNAIGRYGADKRWDDLERWGARLIALAGDPRFAADPAIRLSEAKGAVNAIISYGKAGMHGSGRDFAWKRRLAFVSQAFPVHAEIQEKARTFDLTWTAQQRRNFVPYGRLDKASDRK